MSLSQREKTMVVIAVYALAFFCFVWFLYLPQQDRTASLQAENQQLSQEKMRLEAIRKKQEQQAPVSEGGELTSVKEQLPTQEEMIPVLKYLNDSSKECNVELASLEYRGTKKDEGAARTLTFAVETSGSIFDLIDFLQQLLAAPRFISVADISLNACKAENTSDSEKESTPTYYIAPPGIPQAKLERVKVEVEEVESDGAPERRVADSFIPDQFDMKVTINAYYSPEDPDQAAESNTAETDAADDTAPETGEETGDDDSEGRI